MTRILYGLGIVLVIVGLFVFAFTHPSTPTPTDTTHTILVAGRSLLLADTPELRTQGLSGRESLAPYAGMLFVFPKDGTYGFWMKDMHFGLDLLWIRADGTVAGMISAPPESYPKIFYPPEPIRAVLEVPVGDGVQWRDTRFTLPSLS